PAPDAGQVDHLVFRQVPLAIGDVLPPGEPVQDPSRVGLVEGGQRLEVGIAEIAARVGGAVRIAEVAVVPDPDLVDVGIRGQNVGDLVRVQRAVDYGEAGCGQLRPDRIGLPVPGQQEDAVLRGGGRGDGGDRVAHPVAVQVVVFRPGD